MEKIIFGLDSTKYKLLIDNADNLEFVCETNNNFFSAMQKLGIIIENGIDETNKIIVSHREQIYENKIFSI